MNKKRSLIDDLKLNIQEFESIPDIDINKVKERVNKSICSAYSERKTDIMKSKKKVSLIALAAIFILGITVCATNGVKIWYSSSSSDADYKSLPTAQQCIKDIGFAPVLIDTFENGYSFKDGSIVKNDIRNEGDKSVEKFKSVVFRYKKAGDELSFWQQKLNKEIEMSGSISANAEGIDIYYNSYTSKNVPPDYKMTEEDKKAEEQGALVFSYGSSEITVKTVQNISWVKDGFHYNLMQINGKLSADELIETAKEIICKQ